MGEHGTSVFQDWVTVYQCDHLVMVGDTALDGNPLGFKDIGQKL
jgi:hypothetical protein